MKEMNGRTLSLISLQFLSFILMLAFASGMDKTPFTVLLLIIIESLIIALLRKGLRTTVILWQFQVFIVALIGLIFYPKIFLNTPEVSVSIQVLLVVSLVAVESIIVILYKYLERAVVWVLKGSLVSMLCIVLLILALVGSEGLYGFSENNPIEMLTTVNFNAKAQSGYNTLSQFTAQVSPYNFTAEVSNSHVHLSPDSKRNLTLTIENTGAMNDTYKISFEKDPGIGFSIAAGAEEVSISSGKSVNISCSIKSQSIGDYSLSIVVDGNGVGSEECSVLVTVSQQGLDFSFDKETIYVQGLESSMVSVPLSLTNTGETNQTCLLKITAPKYFQSFINIPEWNHTTESATFSLERGELFNFTLIPRFVTAVNGIYTLIVGAYESDSLEPTDTFTLIFDADANRLVIGERAGAIPVVAGTVTHWNITIINPGERTIELELTDVPDGLTISALRNGSEPITVVNGHSTIYLDGDGNAKIMLLVSTSSVAVGSSFAFDVNIFTGGNQLTFGMLGFIVGSVLTTAIAIILAVPAGLGSAIFLSHYCSVTLRRIIRPIMDILVGVPSVIFGLWGAMTFGPLLADTAYPVINDTLGKLIPFFSGDYGLGRSMMTASVVLAIMIFPIVMALSYEAISSVPTEIRDSSLSLGATRWQTIQRVVLKDARSGVLGAIILGIGRALGETMAVLMIMNYSTAVPSSVFSSGATMTSAIAVNFGSAFANDQARHGLFSIALLLFLMVLVLNYALNAVTRKHSGKMTQTITNFVSLRSAGLKERAISLVKGSKATPIGSVDSLDPRTRFSPSTKLRRYDTLMTAALYIVSIVIILIVGYILGDIFVRGGLAFQLDFLTETQLSGGGFLNAISGSMMLIGLAVVVALPLTLLAAIYVSEYSEANSRLSRVSYVAVSALSSTPSIIFGAFGFMLFVLYLGFGFSLLAGGLTLAFMAVPIFYVSNIEAIRAVPQTYREASYALGISKWKTIQEVILPSSIPAISSGVMVGIGRIIGETAAILFTAGFATFITASVAEPAASLPVMIYHFYESSAGNPVLMEKMYGAAFLLIALVVVLNLIGKSISYFYSRKVGVR